MVCSVYARVDYHIEWHIDIYRTSRESEMHRILRALIGVLIARNRRIIAHGTREQGHSAGNRSPQDEI